MSNPVYRRAVPYPPPAEPSCRQIPGCEPFLRAISEEPLEDLHRLALADWLEDNGDPARAEFIRLQVRLAHLPEHDPQRFDLEERSEDLLAEHRPRWLSHLPKWARGLELTFRRGLPEAVKMSPAAWLRHGKRLAELVPLTRLEIDYTGVSMHLGEVARLVAEIGLTELKCSLWSNDAEIGSFFTEMGGARLRRLVLGGGPDGIDLVSRLLAWPGLGRLTDLEFVDETCRPQALLASPNLARVERLVLRKTRNSAGDWFALAGNIWLTELRSLSLGEMEYAECGLGRALAAAPWSKLENLRLLANHAGPEDLVELLSGHWGSGLRSLDLSVDGDAASQALGQAHLPRLEALTLTARRFGRDQWSNLCASGLASGLASLAITSYEPTEGIAAVLAQTPLTRLSRLSLSGERIGESQVRALLDSGCLKSLRELSLFSAGYRTGMAPALAACSGLSRLRALTLRHVPFEDHDFATLASSRYLGDLSRLNLRHTDLNDDRLAVMLGAPWLSSLRELCLSHNIRITDRGAAALAACPALSRLRLLDLRQTAIHSTGAAALAGSPHLDRLSRLVLPIGRINTKTQDRLRERFGTALVLESF
jgi:uncharacterized protein (TIGR02996 family)